MSITVYSKPACVQCTATTRALQARGIEFAVVDLTQDEDAYAHVSGLGYRQAPVVTRPCLMLKVPVVPFARITVLDSEGRTRLEGVR